MKEVTKKNYEAMEAEVEEILFDADNDYASLDSMDLFLRDMKASSRTGTKERNEELLRRFKDGDESVREEILLSNTPLVVSIAKKYVGKTKSFELSDLIAVGEIGLIRALDKYDAKTGAAFSTYAYYWINSIIVRELNNFDQICRVPVEVNDKKRHYKRFVAKFEAAYGHQPDDDEICAALKLTDYEINAIKDALVTDVVGSANAVLSTEADGDAEIIDFLRDETTDIEVSYIQDETTEILLDAVDRYLNARIQSENHAQVRDCIYRFYGIGYARDRETLESIASTYGISKQAVQIKTKNFIKFAQEDTKLQNYFSEYIGQVAEC